MLLKGFFLSCAGPAIALTLILSIPGDAPAQTATSSSGVCQRCHQSNLPLPDKHPSVKGATVAECASCHASQAGEAKANPFASRLHRAHVNAKLDCTGCHAYTPGSRFAAALGEGNLGALDLEQYDRLRSAVATWANSKGLASLHGNKQNLSCGACHQSQLIPDDNESVVNKQCVTCHGDYDKLALLSTPKLKNPNINPHGSHLGPEIACTACHQGHQESKAYCVNCHTNFDMPMP
jgi:hypothetical protein